MRINELKQELKNNNIKETVCLINPKICLEGALCLKKEREDLWIVILNERGEFRINEQFRNEEDACKFMLLKVISDPTYRKDFNPKDLITFKKNKEEILKKYGFNKET